MKENETFENTDKVEIPFKEGASTEIRDISREKEIKQLRDWYVNFIKLFRKQFSTLSKEEQSCISNSRNYLDPCQIEVFWVTNPSLQLIVQSNLPNSKDMEIIIHGPFTANEFKEKANLILQESRWDQTLDEPFQPYLNSNYRYNYAEHLARQLHKFMAYSRQLLFDPILLPGQTVTESGLNAQVWTIHYIGNIAERNYEEEVKQVIDRIQGEARSKQEDAKKSQITALEHQPKDQTIEPKKKKCHGFAVYLFPPYFVGKKPKPSISELLDGNYEYNWKKKAFDLVIYGHQIVVNKNGLFFVESANNTDAIRIFNVVMGLGLLDGFPLFTVRERDISIADYDENNMGIFEWQWYSQTIRENLRDLNRPKNFYLNYPPKEISVKQLRHIIQKAFEVNSSEKLAEDLRLFTEAFTHLENGEYDQSFIRSWNVIERKYLDMWRTALDKHDLDHEQYPKPINSTHPQISHIIKVLNQNAKIDDQEHGSLMELKNKRNLIYHEGKIASQEDAKKCLDFITKILRGEIDHKNLCLKIDLCSKVAIHQD